MTFYSLSAQVYWNGGEGKWSEAVNWSTGQVPSAADSVVINTQDARVEINSGELKIKALYLGFRSELTIGEDVSLTVAGGSGDAITSPSGKFFINGTLKIIGATQNGMTLLGRNQFYPTRIENHGIIEVSGSGRNGIEGGFIGLENNGMIISESNTFFGISIGHATTGSDINNGTIISRNNGSGMIIKTNQFINSGSILISNSDGNGLTVLGNLNNANEVRISDSESRGIEVVDGGSINNSDQSSLLDVSESHVGALVRQGSEITNYGIFNISSSVTNGLEIADSSIYKAIGFNELTIDGAGTGISASGSSFIDLLGATVIITNTAQSACKLFDDSRSLFNQETMFITDNISGTEVFSVNDNAILTMELGAEMVIGI